MPAGDEIAPCTNLALRRATRQLGQLYDEAFATAGVKATQFLLLARIAGLGGEGGPTLQALAADLSVGLSALTHALRPLTRDGLVALRPDPQDRRAKRARLTPLGRTRLEAASACWSAANRRVEALLGADGARQLRALADRLASNEFAAAFRAARE